jgi:hypothetical protein
MTNLDISSCRANLEKPCGFLLQICSYYRIEKRDPFTADYQIATHDHVKIHVSLKVEQNVQLSLVPRHAAAAALYAELSEPQAQLHADNGHVKDQTSTSGPGAESALVTHVCFDEDFQIGFERIITHTNIHRKLLVSGAT